MNTDTFSSQVEVVFNKTLFTLQDNLHRLGVVVGVSYDSDMNQVMQVLERTASDVTRRLPDPPPTVRLKDFGSSSVDF